MTNRRTARNSRCRALVIELAAVGLCLAGAHDVQARGDLVVIADRVVTPERTHEPATIIIRRGRIASIEAGPPPSTTGSVPRADGLPVLDARGHVAIPGLVDARSGAGLPPAANEEASETTPLVSALDLVDPSSAEFERALRGGVTTVALSPGGRAVVGGLIGVLKTDRGRRLDDRVVSAEAGLAVTMGYEPTLGNRVSRWSTPRGVHFRRPGNRMGVVAELRRAFDLERLPVGSAERIVLARARRGELVTFVRARKEQSLRAALDLADELGLRPVLVEPIEGHRMAEEIARRGAPAIVGPFYQLPRPGRLEAWEGDDFRHANASILSEAGVSVAIGSGPLDPPDALRDLAAFAARHGLSDHDALAAITSTPARLLGVSHRVGSLVPGADGDVVLLSGDPLDVTARVVAVVIEGRVVFREDAIPPPTAGSPLVSRLSAGRPGDRAASARPTAP